MFQDFNVAKLLVITACLSNHSLVAAENHYLVLLQFQTPTEVIGIPAQLIISEPSQMTTGWDRILMKLKIYPDEMEYLPQKTSTSTETASSGQISPRSASAVVTPSSSTEPASGQTSPRNTPNIMFTFNLKIGNENVEKNVAWEDVKAADLKIVFGLEMKDTDYNSEANKAELGHIEKQIEKITSNKKAQRYSSDTKPFSLAQLGWQAQIVTGDCYYPLFEIGTNGQKVVLKFLEMELVAWRCEIPGKENLVVVWGKTRQSLHQRIQYRSDWKIWTFPNGNQFVLCSQEEEENYWFQAYTNVFPDIGILEISDKPIE